MERYLGIYLNDQLAAGTLWRELAKRAERNNRGTESGDVLAGVATAITEDVQTFRSIMRRLGVRPNPGKVALGLAAERVARLKLNGQWKSYSPLSRFIELETLAMGIEGKKILWSTLRDLAGLARRLPDIDFDALIERAAQQRAAVEPWRRQAGVEAFAEQGH